MQKLFHCIVMAALVGTASAATAGELKLTMANGRVTLIADGVPLRQILAEWGRIGQTKIVNGDKLLGPPMTLILEDRPEGEVLDLLLRSAAGYVAAPRPADQPGPSFYDRIVILPTSRAPAVTASAPPPTFNRPPLPMPVQADDDDDPREQNVVPPPGMLPPGMPPIFQNQPGQVNLPQFPGNMQPNQQPLTAPRPGMLPPPVQQPPNPFIRPGGQQPTRPGGGGPGGEG